MSTSPSPLVVVAGANGRLGRLIVASLLAQPGVTVRALVRRPADAADLASDRVELHPFDLNTASEAELSAVKGLPPSVARAIIAARPFATLDEVCKAKGMGPKMLAKLRDQFVL